MNTKEKSNAISFIEAYNKIDKALRAQYDVKASVPFTQMIRQVSPQNSLIAKYEDELADYARLRNAIVHGMTGVIIAQPSDEVVEKLKNIANLLTAPPLVIDVMGEQKSIVLEATATLKDAILTISKLKYSHIPVLDGKSILGILNSKVIITSIGKKLGNNVKKLEDYLEKTAVKDIVSQDPAHYGYADSNISIVSAMTAFHTNRRLQALIITKTGDAVAPIIAIITATDIIRFGNVLDKIQQF